jgi:hypothetical protein
MIEKIQFSPQRFERISAVVRSQPNEKLRTIAQFLKPIYENTSYPDSLTSVERAERFRMDLVQMNVIKPEEKSIEFTSDQMLMMWRIVQAFIKSSDPNVEDPMKRAAEMMAREAKRADELLNL